MGVDNLGALIREMRKAAGMSQMKLAEKIGVSYQQVQKYEKGVSKLSVPRLKQIADVFGVPVISFIEEPKGVSEVRLPYSGLSDEEAKLLVLFRRLKRKKLREGFIEMMRDIVRLAESSD